MIIDDAQEAIRLFSEVRDNQSIYRWNLNAARVFLARVYVYIQDWEKAIGTATAVIDAVPVLLNLNDKIKEGPESANLYYFNRRNPEILFSYGYGNIRYFVSGAKGAYPASSSLTSLYQDGDLRYSTTKGAYIRKLGNALIGGGGRKCPYKSDNANKTHVHGFAFRNVEAYLLRAEALSHTERYADAMKDIEFIRKNRFEPSKYKTLEKTTQEEIIEAVRTERRLEMCFEQLRWFDLRRWDRPRIVHTYTPDVSNPDIKDYFVLEENDPAYTLPVPTVVYNNDPDIINIGRPERNGEETNPDQQSL